MVFQALSQSLDQMDISATSPEQARAQEDAVTLSFAHWTTASCPDEVIVDLTCMTEEDGAPRHRLFVTAFPWGSTALPLLSLWLH